MKEIDLFGVLISPFARDLALAALIFAPVKLGLDRAGFDRVAWHRPLADVSLFAMLLGGVTLAFAASAGLRP